MQPKKPASPKASPAAYVQKKKKKNKNKNKKKIKVLSLNSTR